MIQPPLIFSGTSNRELAEKIAKRMQTRVGNALVDRFKNNECRIEIRENVRGAEVFVLQSICNSPAGSVNDSLMELLLMIDALRRASANRITAVVPYYGYAKQDKKTKGREPISAKLVANMLETAGAERLVTLPGLLAGSTRAASLHRRGRQAPAFGAGFAVCAVRGALSGP